MSPIVALALRRGMILAGAIGSAMVAHTVVSGQLLLTPLTPLWWGVLTFSAMLVGKRTGWRARGFGGTLVLLGLLQASVHVVMGSAPWLFGLDIHHLGAMMSPAMLLTHVVAMVLSAWLIARAERIIDGALSTVAYVARVLAERPPRRSPRPVTVPLPVWLLPRRIDRLVRASRAPPARASV